MRLPKLFSLQNNSRYYKVKIKGSKGTITFEEVVRRSFVTELLVKNMRRSNMGEGAIKAKINYEETRVIEDVKQLAFFEPMFRGYVDEVRRSLMKKNISIANYSLHKITIAPHDSATLSVVSEVAIEVVK